MYYSSRLNDRAIALQFGLFGSSFGDLHSQRKALINLIQHGNPFVLQSWPLLLQWRHDGPAVRAVRLQSITMVDQGRYEAGGGYAHDGRMRVRVDAVPDSTLVRTQDELCELQVKLVHDAVIAACDLADSAGDRRSTEPMSAPPPSPHPAQKTSPTAHSKARVRILTTIADGSVAVRGRAAQESRP